MWGRQKQLLQDLYTRMFRTLHLLRRRLPITASTIKELSAVASQQVQHAKCTSRPAPTPFGHVWHPSQPKGLPARPEDGLPPCRNSSAARAYVLAEAVRTLEPGRAGLRGERGCAGGGKRGWTGRRWLPYGRKKREPENRLQLYCHRRPRTGRRQLPTCTQRSNFRQPSLDARRFALGRPGLELG